MKRSLLLAVLFFIGFVSFAQKAETFTINPTKSIVKWSGKKIVGGNTEGTISISNGNLQFNAQKLAKGDIVMDTKSITSEKASPRLVEHLKNEDFFDVEKYPTATFKIESVKGNIVKGIMTIKGIAHSLSFPADITYSKDVVVAKANGIKVNRTLYNVKYKSGSIFSGLGDGAIEDNFVLDIILVSEKK